MLTIHRQSGAVLLLILLVVIIGMSAVLLSIYSKSALQVENDQQTARVLAEAKAALLSYAVTYALNNPGEYGFLPCPDLSVTAIKEGGADGSCGSKDENTIGRLPWRTLGLPALRDGAGECLWYAVSGYYKAAGSAKTDMLNEDTNGLFSIYDSTGNLVSGSNPEDRVVAIIIAPGKRLSIQNSDRTDLATGTPQGTETCGGNYTAASYLEGNGTIDNATLSGTADTVDSFINASASSKNDSTPFNDQIITITREEIWEIIRTQTGFDTAMSNLTQQAAQCMADFGNTLPTFCGTCNPPYHLNIPWPADMDLGAAGTDYRVDSNYTDPNVPPVPPSLFGRLPNIYDDSESYASKTSITTAQCMQNVSSEMEKLYQNWKDHLFYVVGWGYEPFYDAGGTDCDTVSSRDCPIINNDASALDKLYPGIVIFSHDRETGITRNAPPPSGDSDDKQTVSNYLEGNNASNYTDYWGTKSYQTNGGVNDLLFCIQRNATSLSVSQCP